MRPLRRYEAATAVAREKIPVAEKALLFERLARARRPHDGIEIVEGLNR